MSDFIDELVIVNIVSRLPVESVLQCRCVCKRWRDVLHEQHFTQIHTDTTTLQQQQQQEQTVSLFMNLNIPEKKYYEFHLHDNNLKIRLAKDSFPHQIQPQQQCQQQIVSFFMLVNIPNTNNYEFHLQDYYYAEDEIIHNCSSQVSRPLEPPQLLIGDIDDEGKGDTLVKWFIIGSINGLIALYGYYNDDTESSDYCNNTPIMIIIYNPITREYLNVPTDDDDESLCIQDGHHMTTGFGYNPNTKEYKIVRIIHQYISHKVYPYYHVRWIQIYTLGSGKWRITKEELRFRNFFNSTGVPFKGAIYWLSRRAIFCLDLEDEVLRQIPAPPIDDDRHCELRVFTECLCVIEDNINIWIMNNNNNNNNTSIREYSKFSIPRRLMWHCFSTQCKLIDLTSKGRVLCLYNKRSLASCDPKAGTHEFLGDIPLFEGSFDIVSYTKSLVSLKALGEEDAKIIKQQPATEKKRTYTTNRRRSIDMKTQMIKLFTSLLLNLFVD